MCGGLELTARTTGAATVRSRLSETEDQGAMCKLHRRSKRVHMREFFPRTPIIAYGFAARTGARRAVLLDTPINKAVQRRVQVQDQRIRIMTDYGTIPATSALPSKADISHSERHVCFVPGTDASRCSKNCGYSITSSARSKIEVGTTRPRALAVVRLIVVTYLTGF
jgi:hypothetical protein